jgi:hypothetical protein
VVFGQFVTRFPGWVNGRRIMAGVRFWQAWERRSVSAVRRAGRWQMPHRMWAILSGVRHFSAARVRLALSWPTDRTRTALNALIVERLRHRVDPHARALLEEWASNRPAIAQGEGDHLPVARVEQTVSESRA